jgi:mRNA interferase MazF
MASTGELWGGGGAAAPQPAEPASRRPALILGPPDTFGQDFPFVIVAPLTSSARGLSLHVEVDANRDTGLDEVSYVQCELIRSINRRRLLHRLGGVGPEVAHEVATIVKTLLGH